LVYVHSQFFVLVYTYVVHFYWVTLHWANTCVLKMINIL